MTAQRNATMFEILCTYAAGTLFLFAGYAFDTWMMGEDK